MSDFALILSGLGRKKWRTGLLMVTIFIGFLIFAVLAAFQASLDSAEKGDGISLIALNQVSRNQALPLAYAKKIAQLDGVVAVSHSQWFGGYFREPTNLVTSFAVEPKGLLAVHPHLIMPEQQKADFVKFKDSLLIGRQQAEQFGWKIGDQVPLTTSIWHRKTGGYTYPTVVRGIYDMPEGIPSTVAYMHFDYFDEARSFANGQIGTVLIETEGRSVNDRVIRDIETMFENSYAQVQVVSEMSFSMAFFTQMANIALIIVGVSSAALMTILMIVGNVMVRIVRERKGEIAVMKTIGFSSTHIARLIIGEALMLILIAGGLGLVGAFFALAIILDLLEGFYATLVLTPGIVASAVAIMLIMGLIVSAVPVWRITKISVTHAFREV